MPIVREHLKNSLQIIIIKCCYQLIEVGGLRGSAEPCLLQIQNIGDRRTEREKHFPETLRAEETLACMQNESGETLPIQVTSALNIVKTCEPKCSVLVFLSSGTARIKARSLLIVSH